MPYRELIPKPGEILVVRTCRKDHTSRNGFQWPEQGPVEAPDWEPTYECGYGLHGLPWGAGDIERYDDNHGESWCCLRVSTDPGNYVAGQDQLVHKCKFRRAEDVSWGARDEVVANAVRYAPAGLAIHYAHRSGAHGCTFSGGDECTFSGGDACTFSGGYSCTFSGDDRCTFSGGDECTFSGGYRCTFSGGDECTFSGGNECTFSGGDWCMFKAGIGSTLISRWFDASGVRMAAHTVADDEVNHWLCASGGTWRRCTPDEEKAAEAKCASIAKHTG